MALVETPGSGLVGVEMTAVKASIFSNELSSMNSKLMSMLEVVILNIKDAINDGAWASVVSGDRIMTSGRGANGILLGKVAPVGENCMFHYLVLPNATGE